MSANRIFLVCSHHPQLENSLCVAERLDASNLFEPANLKHIEDWFERHAKCGNPDDFQLAYQRPRNWDVSPPAQDSVAGAVRMGILNGPVNGSEQ